MILEPDRSRKRKKQRLEDIPFSETLPSEPQAPAPAALFSKDIEARHAAKLHWIKHPIEGAFNTLFHALLSVLPSNFISAFGSHAADLSRWRHQDRIFAKRISRNLNALCPDLASHKEAAQTALKRWWRNMGRTMAEFSKANHLWPDGNISLKGQENLEAARQLGGPLIFVSVHLGTWEAGFTAVHQDLAPPSIGPFQPEPNRFTNRIVYKLRQKRNQYLFPPGQRTAIRLRKLLTDDTVSLTIFIDEVRDRQVHMPLFGRALPDKGNATVAIKLANVSGGTLVPFYLTRTGGPKFDLVILPPIPPQTAEQMPTQAQAPATQKRYGIEPTLSQLNAIFEPVILSEIEQWYMLSELRLPVDFETNQETQKHLSDLRNQQAPAQRAD
ncbi:lysophospholipid acyltransferase family protein [Roseibium algae]|uniref:Lysophospholipid acyltransferase family protein n=1 Tax=Roseibium algae TaxID=3123038 RepID=A0ABU8TLA4_9HYPH